QQRLKLYIKDAQTLGEVNTFLAKSAIQNNVGLRENAALYAKLAPAMQRIGANTAATNQVVDAFGKSLRIGGATAMEAASATIQFAQAMASGKLAGDEFRSISEASPRFLKAIADGSGIAAEKLKEMSSAGALTTEVIARALVKEYHNLSKESESLGYTLEQGTNALKTGFMSLVGEFNEGAGITKYLGSLMADLGVSMIDGAKAAKENGEAVKVWFLQNADNISMVVDMFKLLATVIISRYAVAIVLARVESMRYQSALLTMAAAQAGVTRTTLMMTTALTVAGNAMKGLLAFFGGWVGLALTVAGTVASYVMFNKESEKTTKSLREEGETIEDTVAKYKELTAVQRDKALLDERKNVEATTKSYQDQKSALVANVLQMSRHNDMSDTQAQTMSKLGLWYKEGKITLDQLSATIKNSTTLSQDSKDKFVNLADGVSRADQKAAAAAKVLEALGLATKGAGNEADIAGSKFNKFLTDAETQININKLAAQYMVKYNLDQAKAVDLAKQALALQAQKKDITPAEIKSQQDLLKTETAMADITKARAEAEKKLKKEQKDDAKDLKKFSNMRLEAQTYYDVLQKVNNLDIARIASQKEYINIYKDNLAVATELANIQEMTRREENRQDYNKSLREQIEQLSVIADLTKEGVDYETAKGLAAASFVNDSAGREAAEKSITNALLGQSYALSDQVIEQQTLNQYLKEGMGLEEARFKVALSRISKLSGGKNVYGEFGEDFENATKSLRVLKATEASEVKINSLVRESNILTKATALGYTASNVAVAKLSAATQGLLFSQAESQLKQQEQVDLLNESIKSHLTMNSLLSGENETLREVKATYVTIGDEEAKRVAQSRKALEIAEAYVAKMKEQKANPLGDFSKVDFEVFGDFGNPFKEALDGLNALISGSTKLDESLAIIATQISDLKTQSFVEDMFGNQTAVESLNSQVEKQVALEKDLQKQKAETNEIAYGQGLKFAKSFFKEGS
ncbi:MAG: tape measure protein, partial [Erysipelotrichaceae bacterium]